MPLHSDYQKIKKRFVKQYGESEGEERFFSWIKKKNLNPDKPFPKKKETKEHRCIVKGVEIKESEQGDYYVSGLVATSHIDMVDHEEGMIPGEDIPDLIPKETLESFANQINSLPRARVMGLHHSEGKTGEYCGVANVEANPAKVVQLNDGEYGLYVETKLLKDDPQTREVIHGFESGDLWGFSITYSTQGFETADFDWAGDRLVRVLQPETALFGYTAASNPIQPAAVADGFGYKEFKEMVTKKEQKEELPMAEKESKEQALQPEEQKDAPEQSEEKEQAASAEPVAKESAPVAEEKESRKEESPDSSEMKEFQEWKLHKKELEEKELRQKIAGEVLKEVESKMEVKEKVLKDNSTESNDVPLEMKEFQEVLEGKQVEIKEQFVRASRVAASNGLWGKTTTPVLEREYKSFGTNGRSLEFKGLGLTTNQNTDTDYLQSTAELQDVYDPVIYNALNQATVTWNVLAKDDYSGTGNNQVQFTLKTAANASAAFYTGNSVSTDNVTRLKYQTKFKKLQVGVSVDGDMIAAARGGPVADVFAQEVMDSTMDMLAVLNAALYDEVGLETAAGIIGFEYITDSAGNTTLYNLTRSAANKLAPDSAGDTYINQASTIISMTNLRAAIEQAVIEGERKDDLVFFTHPTQGNLLRGKFDDSRRHMSDRDTRFGFSTDLFVDGVPVFEDKDCNTDDWFLVSLASHRVAIWVPPTIERLGKTGDSEDAFIKMYLATYNRRPRAMVQIYGCATS